MPGNFALQIESFVNSLINKTSIAVPVEEGLKALEILEAVYKNQNNISICNIATFSNEMKTPFFVAPRKIEFSLFS